MFVRLALFLAVPLLLMSAEPWAMLREGAADKNPNVRIQTVTATSLIGLKPEAVALVEAACNDPEENVRKTAAAALGEMQAVYSKPVLRKLLDDRIPSVEFAAAQALWKLHDSSGRALLLAVLDGDQKRAGFLHDTLHDAKMRMHDRAGLVKLGVNEGAGALLGPFSLGLGFAEDLLKDSGAPARAAAAALLATDTSPETVPDLEDALDDKNPLVRAAAAKALALRGSTASRPKIEALLADKSSGVRLIAAAALIRLSQPALRRVPQQKKYPLKR